MQKIHKYHILFAVLIGAIVGMSIAILVDVDLLKWFVASGMITGFLVSLWISRLRPALKEPDVREQTQKAIEPELHAVPEAVTSLFLFNSLHNIAALIVFDPQKASETVEHLANFIRTTSELKKKNQTFLGEEFKAIDLYLTIEKARLGDRLIYEKDFTDACLEIPFPSLTLFPFVDTLIRFGAEMLTTPVSIKLGCTQENQHLVIELQDSVQDDHQGEAINSELRERVFVEAKQRLVTFFGSGVKCTREPLDSQGEHIKILIPLNSAVIARYGISHIPHS